MTTNDDMREEIQGLGTRFDGLEQKFDRLEKKVDGLPTRDDLKVFKDEIINYFRILAEDAKASARLAAEGFDGTLKRIERDLGDLKKEMVNKFSDQGNTLANHNQRLGTLERARRRRQRG